MNRAQRYLSYAAECVRLAQQSTSPTDKALLIKMAEHWKSLAEHAEARDVTGESDEEK
jgi:hypothetical protein